MGEQAAMTDLTREEYHKEMQRERAKLKSVPASPEKPKRLSHGEIIEMALTKHPGSTGEVEIGDLAKGPPKVTVSAKQAEGEPLQATGDNAVLVYHYVKRKLAEHGYTGNGDS